jgi:hypothetical protein
MLASAFSVCTPARSAGRAVIIVIRLVVGVARVRAVVPSFVSLDVVTVRVNPVYVIATAVIASCQEA